MGYQNRSLCLKREIEVCKLKAMLFEMGIFMNKKPVGQFCVLVEHVTSDPVSPTPP